MDKSTKKIQSFCFEKVILLFVYYFDNYFHFLECLSYAMQNFTKTHLLSFALQSGVAMSYDRSFIQETRLE